MEKKAQAKNPDIADVISEGPLKPLISERLEPQAVTKTSLVITAEALEDFRKQGINLLWFFHSYPTIKGYLLSQDERQKKDKVYQLTGYADPYQAILVRVKDSIKEPKLSSKIKHIRNINNHAELIDMQSGRVRNDFMEGYITIIIRFKLWNDITSSIGRQTPIDL